MNSTFRLLEYFLQLGIEGEHNFYPGSLFYGILEAVCWSELLSAMGSPGEACWYLTYNPPALLPRLVNVRARLVTSICITSPQ